MIVGPNSLHPNLEVFIPFVTAPEYMFQVWSHSEPSAGLSDGSAADFQFCPGMAVVQSVHGTFTLLADITILKFDAGEVAKNGPIVWRRL